MRESKGDDDEPDMTCFFDRMREWANDILLVEIEFSVLVDPAIKVLAEGLTGDGLIITVYKVIFHQKMQNL